MIIQARIQSPVTPIDVWRSVTLCRCKYIFARLCRSNRFLYMAQSDNSHSINKATSTSTSQNPFHESVSDLTIIAVSSTYLCIGRKLHVEVQQIAFDHLVNSSYSTEYEYIQIFVEHIHSKCNINKKYVI